MAESPESANVDLDVYCANEIRRHEPPMDSPLRSGAIAGALIAFFIYLLLHYVPDRYSSGPVGGARGFYSLSSQLFFWTVALGGFFGAMTLWLLSATVARLRVTFDAARCGLYAGGIAGAVLGAAIVIGRELLSDSTGIRLNWNLYSTEVTSSSLAFAAIGAVLLSAASAIASRPRPLAVRTPALTFVNEENQVVKAPSFDRLARVPDGNRIRIQYGVKRLMALTALIAVMIGCPLFFYRQLMATPRLERWEVTFVFSLLASSLFVLPYGLWVIFRGPDVSTRLASSIRAWRDLRRRNSNSDVSLFDLRSTDRTDGES